MNALEMRLTNRQLYSILESFSSGFLILDNHWNCVYANQRIEKIARREIESFLGKSIWDEFPEIIGTQADLSCRAAMGNQVPVQFQQFWAPLNAWFEINVYPFADGLSVIFDDITERKHAEQALAETERQFREMLENVHVVSILLDTNGRIMFANDYLASLTGYQNDDLVGQDWFRFVDSNEVAEVRRAFLDGLASGSIVGHYENHIVSRSGEKFLISWNNTLLRDPDGRIIGTASLGVNITDRARAENERLNLSRHIELLMDSTGEGIYGVDRQGYCTFINRSAALMLGYEKDELLGKHLHSLLRHTHTDGTAYPVNESPVYDTLRTGETHHVNDELIWRKSGTSFPIELSSYPIIDGGQVRGAVMTFIDVSQQKALRAQFMQAQKMEAVGRLAGGIAHDFNNILTVVLGCSHILLKDLDEAYSGREFAAEIHEAGQRAAKLTSQLLSFSRKQILVPKPLDLNGVVSEMQKLLRRVIGEDIELITISGTELGVVCADQGQLEQVILNIAVNARDAMPSGGKLIMETQNLVIAADSVEHAGISPGVYTTLTISDTGEGMNPSTISHIFEPFFTTKGEGKGTGLGLATAYGIIKQSGGNIRVQSALGHGAAFRIYLPCVDQDTPSSSGVNGEAKERFGSESILVVEDDDRVRALIKRNLERAGYQVRESRDGEDALALMDDSLALVVSDVVLPNMNGYDLSLRLREQNASLRFLFITGYTDSSLLTEMQSNGCTILQKPFSGTTLAAKVRDMLDASPEVSRF